MLENYSILREEKEQERKRQRDQKRLQGQLVAEQEVLFGSKPSPSKNPSSKKMLRSLTTGTNRRRSFSGTIQQTPKSASSARKEDTVVSTCADLPSMDVFKNMLCELDVGRKNPDGVCQGFLTGYFLDFLEKPISLFFYILMCI
ncbi:65-kDa microtubule-associated protein 3-like [Iris pallida]|uniref:65-kDa microtubule-associated protein 3-like n=1 Tax=Iris pallida TaxID=29817 RepID=A0AAX6GPF1_IRIPA|nr:65-kDa microtubule-associated protein 3-like [Iris pallida]